jgi:hypothetical protein
MGWTVGTGVAWAFAPHWSVTFECDHDGFGSSGLRPTDPANSASVTVDSFKDTIPAVAAGLNLRRGASPFGATAVHASPRTTKLNGRTHGTDVLSKVERITTS